jgi:cytochrome P450|tara:strand:+ start:146 stop:1324 length:1179 start_codon:yes stop_codon:yes gene_type:complete
MRAIPIDSSTQMKHLTEDPYPIYKRYRAESPVVHVASIDRTFITKYEDCRYVKNNPDIFSSKDSSAPMERAFQAQTLMKKDGDEHQSERNAMAMAYTPKSIVDVWQSVHVEIAEEFVDRLPQNETIDLFPVLAGPYAARCLAKLLGISNASDNKMEYWSQTLMDGAGNYGRLDSIFERCDIAHKEMNSCIEENTKELLRNPQMNALSLMVNAENPIPNSQIAANIKVAIGGGINEPRDALLIVLYGLLTNPEQLDAAKNDNSYWAKAVEEAVRWVAPIQVSPRIAAIDTEIRGYEIKKGATINTIQASANHDEDVFEEADKFDIFRDKKPHQAFGNGPHFCQGMHVARTMLITILPMLFQRFPNMQLTSEQDVRWSGFVFRGPLNLPIILRN